MSSNTFQLKINVPDVSDGKDVATCFKMCVGGYVPGNSRCNDAPNRTFDCVKVMTEEEKEERTAQKSMERMDLAEERMDLAEDGEQWDE